MDHAHHHNEATGTRMVVISLILFFILSAIGHYVFVASAHSDESSQGHRIEAPAHQQEEIH